MSVAAQKWAWAQNVPQKPKFVLVTLADQTDEQTGRVCYGETSAEFFVVKCGITLRSFYRCVAALVRQGYMKRESHRGRPPMYWLCLDREPSEMADWDWSTDIEAAQDIDEGCATVAQLDTEKVCHHRQSGVPLVAQQDSLDKPKYQKPPMEKPKIGFSRSAQDLDRKAKQATDAEPGELPGMTFVIEGTRWWSIFMAYRRSIGRPMNITDRGIGKYRGKTGRYVKTELWEQILKPHSTAGPPKLNADGVDERAAAEFAEAENR